jgi:hypothetical protein
MQANLSEPAGTAKDRSYSDAALAGSFTRCYTCPCCGRRGKLEIKLRLSDHWVGLRCVACGSRLDDVSKRSGIPRHRLLNWERPPEELGPPDTLYGGTEGEAAPLPSMAALHGHRSALFASRQPLLELLGRGLLRETLFSHLVGLEHDTGRYVLPVFLDGDVAGTLANVRYRRRDGRRPKYTGLRGRSAELYLGVPADDPCYLAAGEFDAMLGAQHGLAITSTTCGATITDRLAAQFRGRQVAVVYDVGEEAQAWRTVLKLREFKAAAWRVLLRRAGLRHGEDLTDWFVKYSRTADDLRELASTELLAPEPRGSRREMA